MSMSVDDRFELESVRTEDLDNAVDLTAGVDHSGFATGRVGNN